MTLGACKAGMRRVLALGMSPTIRAQRPGRQRRALGIRRVAWIFGAVVVVSFASPRSVFAQTAPDKLVQTKPLATAYAGDDACITCHQAKGETYRPDGALPHLEPAVQ